MTEINTTLDPSFRASLSRYLTQDIIEGLPERSAMTKASRHLNTVRVALSSFLPRYIADSEDLLTEVYSDLRPGTFMFADVSGFTALSEKLQQATGVEGAEIMTQIINDFFATMLEILAKSDGQMLKFAGDALLTFFPIANEDTDDPSKTVAGKAIRTGLRMQRAMRQKFQPIQHPVLKEIFGEHDLQLTMSIGIARGRLFEALVGNATQRDHIILGSLPATASAAEEAGLRDDVIVTAELADVFKDEFTLAPAPQGQEFFQVVDDLGNKLSDFELTSSVNRRRSTISNLMGLSSEVNPLDELRTLLNRVDNYARFVAAEVVNKLAIEGDRVQSQNRPATVMFAYFRGIAQLLDAWGENELPRVTQVLNRFYNSIHKVIASYGGSLTRSDPYRDGSKLLITFGAPIAHPDDPFRAVATALGMMEELKNFNAQVHKELPPELQRETYLELRMGIAHGQAFAGEVGWKQRREYTVMGDDVNLAARLMGMSQMGQLWISQRIYNRVERFFEITTLEPMKMKGKSKPVQPYHVTGWQAGISDIPRTSNTRFIGRDTVLLTTEYTFEQVRARRRRVLALVGYHGIGKTRIAKQILNEARKKGFTTAWATCLTMDNARVTWDTLISQLLGINTDATQDVQQQTLHTVLEKLGLPELEIVLSDLLFGNDGDAHADMKRSTRQISGEIVLNPDAGPDTAVSKLLEAILKEETILIVMDDVHKANPVAVRILRHVIDAIKTGRLLILMAYEPDHDFYDKPNAVEDLKQDETYLIATDILHASELGSKLSRILWQQTHGRPLFIEAMLQLWQEEDLIVIHRGIAELKDDKKAEAIPDQIRNLVISMFDRLPHDEQVILQAAAVMGSLEHQMTPAMLVAVAGMGNVSDASAALKPLIERYVLVEGDGGKVQVHYGLAQQAIYESLTRIQRQNLHAACADYLQKQPDAAENFFVIAQHLVKSGKLTRALEMIEAAAQASESENDYQSAIEFYEHALVLFPNDRSLQRSMARVVQKAARAVYKLAASERDAATAVSTETPATPSTTPQPTATPPSETATAEALAKLPDARPKRKVDPLSITNVVRTVMNDKTPPAAPQTSDVTTPEVQSTHKKRKWLSRFNLDKK